MRILGSIKSYNLIIPFAVILLTPNACTRDPGKIALREETKSVEEWRDQRIRSLLRDDGWLTLVGLHWLETGENTIGSDPSMDVVLPEGKAPGFAGTLEVEGQNAVFEAAEGVEITHNGEPVQKMRLQTDKNGEPTILQMGDLRFYVIDRDGRRGVRVKDRESIALKEFSGLDYFPIDRKWRVSAHFIPSDSGSQMEIPTILGTTTPSSVAGKLVFDMYGESHSLIALGSPGDKDLFLVFGDATNGKETYHGGRFLVARVEDGSETATIDFNKAYNPPCVFTPYATCPLPPQENRLAIRVEAGEKMYGEHH